MTHRLRTLSSDGSESPLITRCSDASLLLRPDGDVIMSQNNVASAALGLVMLLGTLPAGLSLMFFPCAPGTPSRTYATLMLPDAPNFPGVFFAFFDYMLKFGSEKACIISSTTGKPVCGYVLDASQEGCVLTDHEGWQCA